ncbi:uncharacterized protein ACR2FA_001362 [Aphomia sociella]
MSAVELQQQYYEAVGDYDWELYEKKDRKYLLQKIAVALYGPPTKAGNLETDSNDLKLQGYDLKDEEAIMSVFEKICEQAKYSHNGDNILISILRIVCVIPSKEVPFYKITPDDYWQDLHLKKEGVNILIFHVFSLRKCVSSKVGEKGCRIYIDHDARVYQDWDSYLTKNNMPKCVMVVPTGGEYRGDFKQSTSEQNMPLVRLTVAPSPALGIGAKVLSVADGVNTGITYTAASIGGIVAFIGAVTIPAVAPAALGTAIGIGIGTGIYGIVRSSIRLADRGIHKQSINIFNSEARGCWINIVVSTAGISFSAASKILSWAAASGSNIEVIKLDYFTTVPTMAYNIYLVDNIRVLKLVNMLSVDSVEAMLMNAVTFLKYTNILTSFVGVANSLGEMINKFHKYNETPTTVELFQFTTSVLFLGIGVMSNQTAQDIVQDAQANTINEVRDSLSSNVKRKMFDKVTAETRRVQGTVQGNSDVIKALKTIENKDDFFGKIARINKGINKNKLRISLSPDGNPLINNEHKINISDISGLSKHGRNQLLSQYEPAKVTTKNAPTRIYPSNASANGIVNVQEESILQCNIRPEEIIRITNFILQLNSFDQEYVAEILSQITALAHDAFLLICVETIASLLPDEIAILTTNQSPRDHKVQMVFHMFQYFKSKVKEYYDIHKYDDIYKFRKAYGKQFMELRAGEVVNIYQHKIFIKEDTIEKLQLWVERLPQDKCDLFIKMCFKIISLMSHTEINELNLLNPDEDVIIRVSHFLLNEINVEVYLEELKDGGVKGFSVLIDDIKVSGRTMM